ncbi:FAD-dependent oxidoreductase [Limosilactobacillus fermentum]|uniref:FAD-dependent oxidoreductase n=1 Tax=Limosilactobacillus fermentum TaxID=1613 RepID=UPI002165DC3E|nr:FAD-dependent oxidoreductase [Limosilactobacillus fermentum]UVW03314.1 FAD-dependent oxidoreductase [Limosilactobacillus fermentum]WEN05781.1 FAD-dependent oxidoreductase [Limosilactobacillus fermentum]WEN12635.1 FAD-dependent oxidoreductase [Limosilactobacillus fermentum]WJD39290.1 FAD-dependent oxidoreductase [Limosilactobacillus fermentum]
MDQEHIYDLIIIGAGPAGLSAGIYAGRATLDTLILEADTVGGQVTTTSIVYNYPAAPAIDGTKLANQMQKQAADFGVTIKRDGVQEVQLDDEIKVITTKSGHQYQARSVVVATGAHPRKVGFKGEDEFRGRGVAYCSTCDGELFSGLQVFVVGGGYAAAEEADYLTRYAKHVTVLVRGDHFSCPPLTASRALDNPKVSVEYNTEIKEVSGDTYLTAMTLVNNQTGQEQTYQVEEGDKTFGVFVYVGTEPETGLFKGQLDLDSHGYILADEQCATNIAGVYAAGDVLAKELRQIITAASDGALAATNAEAYVTAEKKRLGLPVHVTPAKPAAKTVGQTSQVADQPAPHHTGDWFTPDLVEQLKAIFGRLTKDVTLQVLGDDSQLSQELTSFVDELAKLDSHLQVATAPVPADLDLAPQLRLLVDGLDTGLHFAGVPTGHEINSLILGIYNVAGPGQEIAPELVERIKALPATEIEIGVSLTCHFCPDVVAACQRMASLNPHVTATMIDLQHFPQLREERQIMSVPATMIDGGPVIFGSQTLEELVQAAEQATVKS